MDSANYIDGNPRMLPGEFKQDMCGLAPQFLRENVQYMNYHSAASQLEQAFFDPTKRREFRTPRDDWTNGVIGRVEELISDDVNPEVELLGFVPAVGTALDQFHGQHAFFLFQREDGERVRVSVHVTQKPGEDSSKADITVNPLEVNSMDTAKLIVGVLDLSLISKPTRYLVARNAKADIHSGTAIALGGSSGDRPTLAAPASAVEASAMRRAAQAQVEIRTRQASNSIPRAN